MVEPSNDNSPETKNAGRILVLDYGSQFTQLIARRIREQQVYCEIHPGTMPARAVAEWDPAGIVLSGGPSSVYADGAPDLDLGILDLERPVFAICYGMQLLAHRLGGHVEASTEHEYGRAALVPKDAHENDPLFAGGPRGPRTVWMSHGDRVQKLPEGFITLASSENSPFAAVRHRDRPIWGVQFHPEVAHTEGGDAMLRSFVQDISGCRESWTMERFIESSIERVRQQVGTGHAICGLSGGVDSSVAAALVHRAIGDQLTCIFVDHGLLREGERDEVEKLFRDVLHTNLVTVDASAKFLSALAGVAEPERKRKIIGALFIETFDREADRLAKQRAAAGSSDSTGGEGGEAKRFLVQGTLYPDVIESVSVNGPSDTIKTHHNVGGLPDDMNFELVEPLRELFKDEVREVGRRLGLPPHVVGRHPFPGPGLAIRVMGDVSEEKLRPLRQADAIMLEEIRRAGLYDEIWQALAIFLPVQSVGVMGDMRTYENVIALRMVTSSDAMTADWARVPPDVLATISSRIINEVKGINRVVYDISSKPPATIEWE